MADAMVTGRMSQEKKDAACAILAESGLNASQAINRLFDRIIAEGSADFLTERKSPTGAEWRQAAAFVDSLVLPWSVDGRFERMPDGQIRSERLASRGLM